MTVKFSLLSETCQCNSKTIVKNQIQCCQRQRIFLPRSEEEQLSNNFERIIIFYFLSRMLVLHEMNFSEKTLVLTAFHKESECIYVFLKCIAIYKFNRQTGEYND